MSYYHQKGKHNKNAINNSDKKTESPWDILPDHDLIPLVNMVTMILIDLFFEDVYFLLQKLGIVQNGPNGWNTGGGFLVK